MKNCDYCGHKEPEDAPFCTGCGTAFQNDDGWEPLVNEEASDWILRTFKSALEQFGADGFYRHTVLVLPTREHFPETSPHPQENVAKVFARVRAFAGMQKWPCKLIAQAPDMNPIIAPLISMENAPRGPASRPVRAGGGTKRASKSFSQARAPAASASARAISSRLAAWSCGSMPSTSRQRR
jgi:hypothetical protein